MNKVLNILAISGSLREQSSNTALMKAMIAMAPAGMNFSIYGGLSELPHFNPDNDIDEGPEHVRQFRAQLQEADGVLIVTPEYGNGVPGSLKNALDWLVSSGEFMDKPTAVISASPAPMGGEKAHASLLLTLHMINAKIVEGATMMIPHITLKLKNGEITDAGTKNGLMCVLEKLREAL